MSANPTDFHQFKELMWSLNISFSLGTLIIPIYYCCSSPTSLKKSVQIPLMSFKINT